MALDVQKGQTLLVHAAAGGVGMAAVEIGKILGATVIATAGGARKTAFAREHGADHVIDYAAQDFREEVLRAHRRPRRRSRLRSGRRRVFAQSLRCLAVKGRICPIGFAGGTIPDPGQHPAGQVDAVMGSTMATTSAGARTMRASSRPGGHSP